MQSDSPRFSVVIPTYNRFDLLAQCLACLSPERQSLPCNSDKNHTGRYEQNQVGLGLVLSLTDCTLDQQLTYEIIVTDDAQESTSKTMILTKFPWIRWVQGPGTGPAANRNHGASVARGSWLLFTDDDCLPHSQWLRAFWLAIESNPDCKVFEGRTVPDRPRKTLAERSPPGGEGGNLWSCNFAITRRHFHQLGGFDPQFRVCMEDNDFALRVRQSDWVYPFISNALVVHPWRPRSLHRDGWKSKQAELYDYIRFRNKHPGEASVKPIHVLRLAVRVFVNDLAFVLTHCDIKGIPYALYDFIYLVYCSFMLAYSF